MSEREDLLNVTGHSLSVIRKFCALIQNQYGIVLNEKKYLLIKGRLFRRSKELGHETLESYLEFVMKDQQELRHCGQLIATHTTQWFRELVHFQWVRPRLREIVEKKGKVTFWSAACSTGEEVYSLLFLALLEGLRPDQIRILGTDVSEQALQKAKDLPKSESFHRQMEMLKKKLGVSAAGVEERVFEALGKSIKFRNFNLIHSEMDSKMKFDFIFLRNVLIYFDRQTTSTVCQKLSRHLDQDGHLILGLSESFRAEEIGMKSLGNSIYNIEGVDRIEQEAPPVETSPIIEPSVTAQPKVRLLLIEDSPSMRKILRTIYEKIPNVEVVAETGSYQKAVSLFNELSPNMVSLDMKLEDGTGNDFLAKVSSSPFFHKTKTLLLTDCSAADGPMVMDALAMGAKYYIQKPKSGELKDFWPMLEGFVSSLFQPPQDASNASLSTRADILKREHSPEFILIGSSTGGTEVVKDIVGGLPRNCPPIIVVQHMPESFTAVYAQRMQQVTGRPVYEVRSAMKIEWGSAYIASGGMHLQLTKKNNEFWVEANDGVPVNRFKPSVSVLFSSAQALGIAARSIAIMLTGMGRDGSEEMLHLKRSGALTMAQSRESCAVYGMPAAAVELGAVDHVSDPKSMIETIKQVLEKSRIKKAS